MARKPPVNSESYTLVIPRSLADQLFAHLFPGDHDEHGAVIGATLVRSKRGVRLLARELHIAQDGVDYLPGERGYRMLTASFVGRKILRCRDEELCYLAVHNHGGFDRVEFSPDDLASHERGYPALLQINANQPVGALVFAKNAVAGDIWIPGGQRIALESARILGPSIRTLYPKPPPAPPRRAAMYDRQARLFGDAGQDILRNLKVGVIGAGGIGSLVIEYLAKLGVGHFIIVDPDRIDLTNLPRVVGAVPWDAHPWFTESGRPEWLQRFGKSIATRKVDVMRRMVRIGNPTAKFEGIFGNFLDDEIALRFQDCDFLFLAADSFQARLLFNAMVHQYLIPGFQLGAKVPVEKASGLVGNVFTTSRIVTPGDGCLLCNGLIPPGKLTEESATESEKRVQRYVEDSTVHAPSVISLNAVAASLAVNDFLFAVTGLTNISAHHHYHRYLPRERILKYDLPRFDHDCSECSSSGRLGRGNKTSLPTRQSNSK